MAAAAASTDDLDSPEMAWLSRSLSRSRSLSLSRSRRLLDDTRLLVLPLLLPPFVAASVLLPGVPGCSRNMGEEPYGRKRLSSRSWSSEADAEAEAAAAAAITML